jgi:DMSO/TMAO reductase YedYZ molybdopterin-dependent catalytic subunit
MRQRLRPAAGVVAGVGATLVALAFLGLAHMVQSSVPFPPAGIAQRVVQIMPGPLAVGAIELLGKWALRLFIIGVGIATIALGAVLGRWVANRPPLAAWVSGGALTLLALAGWQPGPGASFLTYAVLCAVAAILWVLQLEAALRRLRAASPVPAARPPRAAVPPGGSAGDAASATEAASGAAVGATGATTGAGVSAGETAPEAVLAGDSAGDTAGMAAPAGEVEGEARAAAAQFARSRRELLLAAAGSGGLLLAGLVVRRVTGGLGDNGGGPLARPAGAAPVSAVAVPAEPATERATFAGIEGLVPELTPNRLHYTVDESIIDPDIDTADWRLRIDGLVGGPVELTYEQLLSMAATEQIVTLVCISNYIGGELVGTAKWTGVPLAEVLARAGGVKPGAVRVAFHAVGGYTDSLPLDKAMDRATVVAYGMNGVALPRAHGYPARIIAPGIYGMKNVKWLERIEVVDYDFKGYWQAGSGWDNIAEIRTGSRIDLPAGSVAVAGGELDVAGVAWAGERGIDRVEVSADGGKTWQPAILRRPLARAAWRQWRARLPRPAGDATILVRAVDGTGAIQTASSAPPYPSGATGYDELQVKA